MKAPLNGRACRWACLGSYDPALVPEAPVGLIKKDSNKGLGVYVSPYATSGKSVVESRWVQAKQF